MNIESLIESDASVREAIVGLVNHPAFPSIAMSMVLHMPKEAGESEKTYMGKVLGAGHVFKVFEKVRATPPKQQARPARPLISPRPDPDLDPNNKA